MINHHNKKSGGSVHSFLKLTAPVAMVSLLLAAPLHAEDYSISGESTTILRMRTTYDKKDLYPLYEYLRVSMSDNRANGSGMSFYMGGWGRADLADRTPGDSNDTSADLQYAYLSYRPAKNNTVINLGRQFVSEGIATERLDGVYLRNDFLHGFGVSTFAGNSVIQESSTRTLNPFVYGGRISKTDDKYYTLGLSALRSSVDGDSTYRGEAGADLWVRPFKQVDFSGRSTYNAITDGWMENSYALAYTPTEKMRIAADFSHINYYDYFYNMNTNVFTFSTAIIDPNEKMTATGLTGSYSPVNNLTISADYKYRDYEIAKEAHYFGGAAIYSQPGSLSAGLSVHRMDGKIDRLRYTEARVYALKKFGGLDVSADFINVGYDTEINGVKNSFALTGSTGYTFNKKLRLGADFEYSKSPDFNSELRGLVKATYAFDAKIAAGGGKNVK